MFFNYLIFFILLFFNISAQKNIQYLPKISSELDFEKLKGHPIINKFSEVEAVKVVYDLKNDSLYFINANIYDYHFSFCVRYLGYKKDKTV